MTCEPCEHCYGQCIPGACDLTKLPQVCYTITTGMSLRDFKDGLGQAYWNRDRETLDRLLESLTEA